MNSDSIRLARDQVRDYIREHAPELRPEVDAESYMVELAAAKGFEAFVAYMTQPQFYRILTHEIRWLKLAQHCVVQLPGQRNCEWSHTLRGPIRLHGLIRQRWDQLEIRQATGRKIEQIWMKHQQIIKEQHSAASFLAYCPFVRDCFTYVNDLLKAHGEPPTGLFRVPSVERLVHRQTPVLIR